VARWFPLRPVDESFFSTAPQVHTLTMDLAAPAAEVWAGLTKPQPLDWIRTIDVRYTSPQPYGVGTLREVSVLGGVLKLRETFPIWDDEAMRHAFYATHASLPFLESFAEDYRVEPRDAGCRFTWTFASRGSPRLGPLVGWTQPAIRRLLYDGFGRATLRHWGA